MIRARPTLLALAAAVLAAHLLVLSPRPPKLQAPAAPAPVMQVRSMLPPKLAPPFPPAAPAPPLRTRPVSSASAAAAMPTQLRAEVASGQPPEHVTLPASMRLNYQVEMRRGTLTLEGTSVLQWLRDDERYEALLSTRMGGRAAQDQHSAGRIAPQGLLPQRYASRQRHEEAVHFEHAKGQLIFSNNRPRAQLLAGAQDRLSVLWQLGAMIAARPDGFPPASHIALQTAGTGEAETWVYAVVGQESLVLPGGQVPTLKLIHTPQREYDSLIEIWLAPGLDYAPVRLRLTLPNGDSTEHRWSSTDRR